MSDQILALKKTIAAVRSQKNAARDALVQIAKDNGFFNPGWGKEELEWLDESLGLDEPADRRIEGDSEDWVVHWAFWWIRFKEWDLLGEENTPYPSRLQKMYEQFLSVPVEKRDKIKAFGDAQFTAKHPGFTAANRLPRFPDELILACWADED